MVEAEDNGDDGGSDDSSFVQIDDSLAGRVNAALDADPDDVDDPQDDPGYDDEDGDGDHEERDDRPSRRSVRAPKGQVDDQTFSQMRLNVTRQARQLTEANRTIKELSSKLEAFNRSSTNHDPADVVELVKGWAARNLGVTDMNDPRIMKALAEAATDLTIEGYEDARNDPALRERAERNRRERELREHKSSVDKQFAEIREEKARLQAERHQAEMTGLVSRYVESVADEFPFMMAAGEVGDIDPTELLFQAATEAVRTGQVPDPRDEEELQDLIFKLASNVEAHYKNIAETFSSKSGKTVKKQGIGLGKSINGAQVRSERRQASTKDDVRSRPEVRKDVRRPTNAGGGGKGRPAPAVVSDDDRDDLASRVERYRKFGR